MIKILGVEFDLDTMDLDVSETLERELNQVPELLSNINEHATRSEMIRETVTIVSNCFDNIFGVGSSEAIFKGKKNVRLAMKAFEELALGIRKLDEEAGKELDEATKKYSPNRAARRNPNHKKSNNYKKKNYSKK